MFFVLALLRLRAERGRNRNLQAIAIFLALAVPLAAGAVLAVVATIGGYLKKVQSLKNPPRR